MTRAPKVPPPGLAAKTSTWPCSICDRLIERGERIYYRRGHPTHCACAPGSDDE